MAPKTDERMDSIGLSEGSEDQGRNLRRVGVWFGWFRSDSCSSKWSCRWPMFLAILILLATPFLLASCSSDSVSKGSQGAQADTQGFVAGDGSLTLLDPDERVPAPELTGQTLDGQTFVLADHLGKVVVLNVWASWCAPCRAEAPALWSVWDETKNEDVQFVGLVTRDSEASARAFADRFELGYPHIMDDDGSKQLLFRNSLPPAAIPSTLIIDKQGRVAGRALGEISQAGLRGFIEPLLAQESVSP